MREPQTHRYLLIVQVHFVLSCVNMRQFSKICNGWRKVQLCGKFAYSSTWKIFQNGCEWSACFHREFFGKVETVKLFVNIRLHRSVSNLEDKQNVHRRTRRGSAGRPPPRAWKISGQTLFSGQAQVAQKSWMIKNFQYSVYSLGGDPCNLS